MLPILSVKDSNQYIIDLLEKNAPFLISRLGDAISTASVLYDSARSIPNYVINKMQQCDGIYCNNINDIYSYCQIYNRSLGTSNALASFPELYTDRALYYYRKHGMTILHNRCLEPFYSILENGTPWTHHLIDKKVLIVSPFIESFRKQLNNNFQMINNKHIFLPNQEFFFYKAYNTLANNRIHSSWYETYNIMCQDISKLEFDVALLGCGGYGVPLCNYIKENLGKSAIYIGGGLQLLFGVMGKRWESHHVIQKIIQDNDCKFIRPNQNEYINNMNDVERGCYW